MPSSPHLALHRDMSAIVHSCKRGRNELPWNSPPTIAVATLALGTLGYASVTTGRQIEELGLKEMAFVPALLFKVIPWLLIVFLLIAGMAWFRRTRSLARALETFHRRFPEGHEERLLAIQYLQARQFDPGARALYEALGEPLVILDDIGAAQDQGIATQLDPAFEPIPIKPGTRRPPAGGAASRAGGETPESRTHMPLDPELVPHHSPQDSAHHDDASP